MINQARGDKDVPKNITYHLNSNSTSKYKKFTQKKPRTLFLNLCKFKDPSISIPFFPVGNLNKNNNIQVKSKTNLSKFYSASCISNTNTLSTSNSHSQIRMENLKQSTYNSDIFFHQFLNSKNLDKQKIPIIEFDLDKYPIKNIHNNLEENPENYCPRKNYQLNPFSRDLKHYANPILDDHSMEYSQGKSISCNNKHYRTVSYNNSISYKNHLKNPQNLFLKQYDELLPSYEEEKDVFDKDEYFIKNKYNQLKSHMKVVQNQKFIRIYSSRLFQKNCKINNLNTFTVN